MTAADPALSRRQAGTALAVATAVTLVLYALPTLWPPLWLLSWPLLMLSTLAHELGHALAAWALGAQVQGLILWPDGSGVASYRAGFGALARAAVAAAGLLGPSLVAFALLVASRSARGAHVALATFAAVLALLTLPWAASLFTWVFCLALAFGLALLAWRGGAAACQMVALFLAVQLALSSFSRADYLFTPTARTGSGPMPSDVAQIAQALWLPYWFWGGLIALVSIALLGLGARQFARTLG